jgi:hypothetical protein
MFGAMLLGVSTRQYGDILPQMAETLGISKSAVSERAIVPAARQQFFELRRARFDVELLVIYIGDAFRRASRDQRGGRYGKHCGVAFVAGAFARARAEHREALLVRDRRSQCVYLARAKRCSVAAITRSRACWESYQRATRVNLIGRRPLRAALCKGHRLSGPPLLLQQLS